MKQPPWWVGLLLVLLGVSIIALSIVSAVTMAKMSSPTPTPTPPRPVSLVTELTAGELRFRAIEKRLLDLESATGDISFRMRLERRVNDEESQRRVDEIVARANASRDAGRDR